MSLLFSQSNCLLLLHEDEHGLQLTLSKKKLRPLQLLVLIVFSPVIPWRKTEGGRKGGRGGGGEGGRKGWRGEREKDPNWFRSPAPFRSEKELMGKALHFSS